MGLAVFEPREDILHVSPNLGKDGYSFVPGEKVSQTVIMKSKGRIVPIVSHVQNLILGSNGDFLEDLLAGMLANVVSGHDPLGLEHSVSTREAPIKGRAHVPRDE